MNMATSQEPRRRWWSRALVVHAVLVLALVVASLLIGPVLMGAEPPAAAKGIVILDLLLGAPWWLLFGFYLPVPSDPLMETLTFSVPPLLINLGIHALVLRHQRARERRAAEGGGRSVPAPPRRPAFVFAIGSLSGAVTWGGWLGWDRSPSYDVVTGTVQTPYVTLQVLGCALTIGVVTAILAARWHPVDAAFGVSAGFWLAWTTYAAFQDDSGLFLVGAMLLAVGLSVGTAVAAAMGVGVRSAIHARRTVHVARNG